MAVFCLSSGCGKPARDGNGPAPGTSTPPKPPDQPSDRVQGRLQFGSRASHLRSEKAPFEGTSIGAEGEDPRKYIAGHPDSPQRAVWHFDTFPLALMSSEGEAITAKLTCSIFRLARRASNKTWVTVRAVTHTCPQTPPRRVDEGDWQWEDVEGRKNYHKRVEGYIAAGIDLRAAHPGIDDWKAVNQLAEEYGFYETQFSSERELIETDVDLPLGLLRNALKNEPEAGAGGRAKRPRVSIYLKCETEGFMLGVMEPDLYLVGKHGAKQ